MKVAQVEFPFGLPSAPPAETESMIRVAPQRWVPKRPGGEPPVAIIADFVRNADGTFRLEPRKHEKMVPLTYEVARSLGMSGTNTLRRLGRCGFIELVKVAPGRYLLNIQSWYNHLRRCAEDPEFWEGKNYEHYKENYQ